MKLFVFICWLFSIALYLFAPEGHNLGYCVLTFLINILCWYVLFVYNKRSIVSFDSVFCFASILVSFIFPIFIYPEDWIIYSFRTYYDHTYITQGTALFNLGIISYILGAIMFQHKCHIKFYSPLKYTYCISKQLITALKLLFYILSIAGLIDLYKQIGVPYADIKRASTIHYLYTFVLSILIILNSYKNKELINNNLYNFIKVNLSIVILSVFFCILCLLVGIRYPVIEIILIMVYVINKYVIKLTIKHILPLGLAGVVLLAFITRFRLGSEEGFAQSATNFYFLFSDLIGVTKNIYLVMDYVDTYGYNYGKSLITPLFSFVPFLPSKLTMFFFSSTPNDLGSQLILTRFLEEVHPNLGYWVGCNIIIDLYMDFGAIWVCLIMFLFGNLINYLENNKCNSLYLELLYLTFFLYSVFIVRACIFNQVRSIFWIMLFFTIAYRLKLIIRKSNGRDSSC